MYSRDTDKKKMSPVFDVTITDEEQIKYLFFYITISMVIYPECISQN